MDEEGEAEAAVDTTQAKDAVSVLGESSLMPYSQSGAMRQQHLAMKPEEDR